MEIASIFENIEFGESRPMLKVLLETDFTKEIRITLKKGQEMKEHQTPFPIVVEVVEGEIVFGVEGKEYPVKKGNLLSLAGGIPHHLLGVEDSIIRLTLSKSDSSDRVRKVLGK